MLRIFGKTTLLAAALFTTASLGLLSPQHASAQDSDTCQNCQDGDGFAAGGIGSGGCNLHNRPSVNCRPQYYGQPELFYNYYIPGTCGGVPANMYLAPQPIPAWVGHTYYTYQPFMPHELLYQHHRSYYRYYNGGRGMTRTNVSWTRPPLTGWYSNLRLAR